MRMRKIGVDYNTKGSSGHHLFISVFILSSKIICDNTYLDKLWCIVG